MKQKIYHLVERGDHGNRLNRWFDTFIMTLIVLNVMAIILDTVPAIHQPLEAEFHYFEVFSVVIFTVEYLMRIYVADLTHPAKTKFRSILKFVFSGYGIIDFLAIIPFYLPFIFTIDLRVVRMLRLMRFFRLFKLARYNKSLNVMYTVLYNKRTELSVIGFSSIVVLIVSSTLIYFLEHDIQPDKFASVADSFWWSISTLTTIGYGDVYPITPLGKILAGFVSIIGIALFAIPTGIISAGFFELKKEKDEVCPHCGKPIHEEAH